MALVFLTALPAGFAHIDTGAHPGPGNLVWSEDPLLNGGWSDDWNRGQAANADRVSGWYYGSADVYLELDTNGFLIDNPVDPPGGCPADNPDTPVDENDLCEALESDMDPGFLFAKWTGQGDLEVGGSGSCSGGDAILNEGRIDGVAGLGSVPDGTFNDGGYGVVLHTDRYDCPAWNTTGCNYAPAMAEDIVVGWDVWIATACHWGIPVPQVAPGPDEVIDQFADDIANCPPEGVSNGCRGALSYLGRCSGTVSLMLSVAGYGACDSLSSNRNPEAVNQFGHTASECPRYRFPQRCFEAVDYLDDCGGIGLLPTLSWDHCDPDWGCCPPSVVCGSGNIGTINFGTGGGTAFPPAGEDDGGVNCDQWSTAAVFPFAAVVTTMTPSGGIDRIHVSTATYGWVA